MKQGKYEFVRLKNKQDGKEDSVWYFRAKTLDEVTLHYNKVLLPTLQGGFNSFSAKFCEALDYYVNRDKTPGEHISIRHADNDVENAIRVIDAINHGEPRPLSMFETTNQMLMDAYKTRIETLMKYGECYLANGVQQFGYSEKYHEICEQCFYDEFVYPTQRKATIDDVRVIRWSGGAHYYAKVGNIDIVDKNGNQKWNSEQEAKKYALQYLIDNNVYL